MRKRFALGFLALAVWLCSSAAAWAVALGKINVASHLGEPFYAEIPLQLDKGESLANVDVSLASPADYRILEIYRDPALDAIQAAVKNDKRGPRVVLSSPSGVTTPFFNLVLKVRYERATHFKKYPIFLDIPKAAQPAKIKALPSVTQGAAAKPGAKPAAAAAAPAVAAVKPAAAPKPGSTFKPFDGWARIGRYGPLVYGDSVSTVAKRLRIDNRYTFDQVMVALYEKNRSEFDHDNINLIRAGTYLDVPKAAEVERISPAEASRFMAKQERAWKQLIKQPKYAAVAEAQKHRYSKRVRMGEKAAGVAEAPVATKAKPAAVASAKSAAQAAAPASGVIPAVQQDLERQNAALKDKLQAAQKQLADLSTKSSAAADAVAAADDAKIKKLEIQVARLQAERIKAQAKAASQPSPLGWLTYALVAIIVLLLAIIGFLMRRERTHPATEYAMPEPTGTASDSGFEPRAGLDEAEDASEAEPEDASGTELGDLSEAEPQAQPEAEAEEEEDLGDLSQYMMHARGEGEAAEAEEKPRPRREESDDDALPELTEEDTGRMEAFQQPPGDQADPNVDYLAEADVYLRYGMDDEAIQQVRMALQLDAGNADAHIKMVQLLRAKDDQAALGEAVAAARQALQGDDLARFEEVVPSDEGTAEAAGSEPVAQDAGEPEMDLDMEWPDFEDAEVPEAQAGTEPAAETEAEAEPAAETEAEVPGGAFDLSDIEIPEPEADATPETGLQMDTGDLEKTVAITRPKDIDIDESGTMFEDEAPAAEAESEPEAAAEGEPEAPAAGTELELGDLDFDQVDLDQAVTSASDDDEFTGTIRKNLSETDEGEKAVPELDLTSELEVTPAGDDEAGSDQADEDKHALDLGDVDAVHDELNNLLDELADEAEKDGDGKKS